ncbi:hypothetical protein IEO21_05374 [Rhodonia placenta]|uniref:Uncharacterized protein n=1 Tax=Rhodonia placenta TaxID=104341 RepID=A0A8H7P227_9APHY|nr:hypothetical protein IEO21_05374 [Postia placenta]
MAKPHGPRATSSGSLPLTPLSHPRQRRRRRRSPARPAPSSSLLALFATVAASASTVDGHPLPTQTPPPEFLCPQLGVAPCLASPPRRNVSQAQSASSSTISELPSNSTLSSRSQPVADKYVSCEDGRWRKTDVWTLYGSTFCQDNICTATPTGTSTTVACGVSPSASSTATPASSEALADDLSEQISAYPSGWLSSKTVKDDPLTPVIISLSVILALAICVFIILCVVWRRRKRRPKDPEKRNRMRDAGAGEEESIELKRLLSQQRLWAKATARWKAGVRQSSRRRWKRQPAGMKDADSQLLSQVSSHSSSTSLHRTYTASSSRSAALSIRSSRQDALTDLPEPAPIASQPDPHQPQEPPAYLSDTSGTAYSALASVQGMSLPRLAGTRHATDNAAASGSGILEPPVSDDHPLPYKDFIHAGHVATDDKALLARMAALASAPPTVDAASPTGSSNPSALYAWVPPLEDEFEAVPFDLRIVDCDTDADVGGALSGDRRSPSPMLSITPSYSRDMSPCPSVLPPPPEKSRLAAPGFYEYPPSFEEDLLDVEPEMEPSAPPFGEDDIAVASAPPLEDASELAEVIVLPSAPPLDGAEMEDTYATAPEWDTRSSTDNARVEQSLPLRRITGRLHTPAWNGSPPSYLP